MQIGTSLLSFCFDVKNVIKSLHPRKFTFLSMFDRIRRLESRRVEEVKAVIRVKSSSSSRVKSSSSRVKGSSSRVKGSSSSSLSHHH